MSESKDLKLFNMTQTVQSTNNDNDPINNHVTQTSFGPIKHSSLLLTRDAIDSSGHDSDMQQKSPEGLAQYLKNSDYGDTANLYKNISTQIDVTASAPFARRVTGSNQPKRLTESLDRRVGKGQRQQVKEGGFSSPQVAPPLHHQVMTSAPGMSLPATR